MTTQSPDVGSKLQYKATGVYSDGIKRPILEDVTWSSSNKSAISIDKTTGLANTGSIGQASIAATSGNITGTLLTSVIGGTPAIPTSIKVIPESLTLKGGASYNLKAMGYYSYGDPRDITNEVNWTSSNTASITVNAESGLVYALARGSSAVSAGYGLMSGVCLVNVSEPDLVKITISPSSPTVSKGKTLQLIATAVYSDQSTRPLVLADNVSWSSGDNNALAVNSSGMLTGINTYGTSPTPVAITAAYKGQTAQTIVTVSASDPAADIKLQRISITPDVDSIKVGESVRFKAIGTYSDGSARELTSGVTWSFVTKNSYSYASLDSNGTVKGLKTTDSSFVITMECDYGTYAAYEGFVIKGADSGTPPAGGGSGGTGSGGIVNPGSGNPGPSIPGTKAILNSILVSPDNQQVKLNGTKQFKVYGLYADGTKSEITSNIKWSITGDGIIDKATGIVTGTKLGNAIITAMVDGKEDSAKLRITNNSLYSVVVSPPYPVVDIGATIPFLLTASYQDEVTKEFSEELIKENITWTSGDTTIATIDIDGIATGVASGNVLINASFEGLQSSTQLGVRTKVLDLTNLIEIQVLPTDELVKVGDKRKLYCYGKFKNSDAEAGQVSPENYYWSKIEPGPTWSISWSLEIGHINGDPDTNPSTLATIDTNGELTAVNFNYETIGSLEGFQPTYVRATISYLAADSSGLPTIHKTISGIGKITTVTNKIQKITITPGDKEFSDSAKENTVIKGGTLQFTVSAEYYDGTAEVLDSSSTDASKQIKWTSEKVKFATIDQQGLATGVDTDTCYPEVPDQTLPSGVVILGTKAYCDPGISKIKAALADVTVKPAYSVVYVKNEMPEVVKNGPEGLVSIKIIPDTPIAEIGDTWEFKAIGTFKDGTTKVLDEAACSPFTPKWTSANSSVGSIEISTGIGHATGTGTTVITFMVGDFTASTEVAVIDASNMPDITLTADKKPASGEQAIVTATFSTSSGSFSLDSDLLGQVVWLTSDSTIATVRKNTTSSTGGNAYVNRLIDGLVDIIIEIPIRVNGKIFKKTAKVDLDSIQTNDNSVPHEPASFAFSPESLTLMVDDIQTITTTVTYKDGTTGPIPGDSNYEITVDDGAVITTLDNQDANGNITGIQVKGLQEGATKLNISFSYIPTGASTPIQLSYSCNITVTASGSAYTLEVMPRTVALDPGATQTFKVVKVYENGNRIDVPSSEYTWTATGITEESLGGMIITFDSSSSTATGVGAGFGVAQITANMPKESTWRWPKATISVAYDIPNAVLTPKYYVSSTPSASFVQKSGAGPSIKNMYISLPHKQDGTLGYFYSSCSEFQKAYVEYYDPINLSALPEVLISGVEWFSITPNLLSITNDGSISVTGSGADVGKIAVSATKDGKRIQTKIINVFLSGDPAAGSWGFTYV